MSKMTVLVEKWNRGLERQVVDLPIDEALKLINRGTAVETMPSDPHRAAAWAKEVRQKAEERAAAYSETYKRFYLKDFRRFAAWCEAKGEYSLPARPELLLCYLLERAKDGAAFSTLRRDCTGIAAIHGLTSHPPVHWYLSQSVWKSFEHAMKVAGQALISERGPGLIRPEEIIKRAYAMFGHHSEEQDPANAA